MSENQAGIETVTASRVLRASFSMVYSPIQMRLYSPLVCAALLADGFTCGEDVRSSRRIACAGLLACVLLVSCALCARATSNVTVLVHAGDLMPDGDGTIADFLMPPDINNLGDIVIQVAVTNSAADSAILKYEIGGGVTVIERTGNAYPLGGTITELVTPINNNAGQTAYGVKKSSLEGAAMRELGGTKTVLVASGQTAPGNGSFAGIVADEMNESGHLVFGATLTGTSEGFDDDSGIYVATGAAVTEIVRENDPAPDGNGEFSFLALAGVELSDSDEVIFATSLRNTAAANQVDRPGLFSGSGGSVTQLARGGQTYDAPYVFVGSFSALTAGGDGFPCVKAAFENLADPEEDLVNSRFLIAQGGSYYDALVIDAPVPGLGTPGLIHQYRMDDHNRVVFAVDLKPDNVSGISDAIIGSNLGGPYQTIARVGTPVPGATDHFVGFGDISVSSAGCVAFDGIGLNSPQHGLYVHDGARLLKVLRTGDPLDGHEVDAFEFRNADSLGEAVNSDGQAAFLVTLNNSVTALAYFDPPAPADGTYARWAYDKYPASEACCRAPEYNGEGDRYANVFEAIYGLEPDVVNDSVLPACHGTNGPMVRLSFDLVDPFFTDVTLEIQQIDDLRTNAWSSIARKEGSGPWTGSATITTGAPDGGLVPVTVDAPLTNGAGFFRQSATVE